MFSKQHADNFTDFKKNGHPVLLQYDELNEKLCAMKSVELVKDTQSTY